MFGYSFDIKFTVYFSVGVHHSTSYQLQKLGSILSVILRNNLWLINN